MKEFLDLYLPSMGVKGALSLSFLTTAILVVFFSYLSRFTRRPYFGLWTVAWLFYGVWIAFSMGLVAAPSAPAFLEASRLCAMGMSAALLYWGSMVYVGKPPSQQYLAYVCAAVIPWCFFGYQWLPPSHWHWIPVPIHLFFSFASLASALAFFQQRFDPRSHNAVRILGFIVWGSRSPFKLNIDTGATILSIAFFCWALLMAFFPFLQNISTAQVPSFIATALNQWVLGIGVIFFTLEEARGEASILREQMMEDARLTRHLQKEMQVSDGRYKHVFEHASDAIFIVDPRSLQILECNRAAQALTGYTSDELFLLRLVDLCPALRDKEAEIREDPSQTQRILMMYGNVTLQRKDKNMVLTEGSASVTSYAKGPTVQIFLREVTERRRLEQQLRQAEKLSALGQLISGVAHELNNPLAVISGYAQLLAMRPHLDEKTRTDVTKIQRESERASKIVQNFLTFARKQPMEKTNANLNELVEVSLELLDYDLRASGIRVIREMEPHLPMVFADPNQLEQVFLNIINNAIQAMEGNPREKVLKVKTESTSSHVKVSFLDHGKGIAPGILDKIFDPFFTTKEVGVGTGLGLSISYSILKEHSGNIYAQNHAEGGAIFTVELPISHIKSPHPNAPPMDVRPGALMGKAPHRQFHVLLVDDETSLHEVFSEMLSPYSCHVHGANNGLQAMELIQQQDFDLIISDLKMPGMDGRRFYEKVHEVKPHLVKNFVFVTGDTNSPKTLEFLQNSGCRWILKPFTFREVEDLVGQHIEKTLAESKAFPSKIRQLTPGQTSG